MPYAPPDRRKILEALVTGLVAWWTGWAPGGTLPTLLNAPPQHPAHHRSTAPTSVPRRPCARAARRRSRLGRPETSQAKGVPPWKPGAVCLPRGQTPRVDGKRIGKKDIFGDGWAVQDGGNSHSRIVLAKWSCLSIVPNLYKRMAQNFRGSSCPPRLTDLQTTSWNKNSRSRLQTVGKRLSRSLSIRLATWSDTTR